MEHEDARHRILTGVWQRDRFPIGHREISHDQRFKLVLRLPDVSLRQIDFETGKPRPSLLGAVEKTPGAAADIEQAQLALIPPGEDLLEPAAGPAAAWHWRSR